MSLRELGRALGAVRVVGSDAVRVRGVRQDSRVIEPGDLFAVRAGRHTDGARYVGQAIERGAVAVLAESGAVFGAIPAPLPVPLIEVADARAAIARAAELVYGNPTSAIEVVGITGTNGKTTTSHLVRAAIAGAGGRAGVVGTLGYEFESLKLPAPNTTPEADELSRIAAAMRSQGATHLVMEVSSHALAQHRVEAIKFAVAAFTNLTQDHLDFHGDMQRYFEAKARLFLELAPRRSVVNVDDPFGRTLAARIAGGPLRVSARPGAADADVFPLSAALDGGATRAELRTPRGPVQIVSPLVGAHNLSNLVVAVGIAEALGLDPAATAAALSRPLVVPGRLERCDGPDDDITVLVDYAHTPDALARVLATVRPLTRGRLLCVFGCGGDRDPGKRGLMGGAAAQGADAVIVTSDNPRSENPRAIIDAILAGMAGGRAEIDVEIDRERAIERAIAGARAGDLVLLAGKGHETVQVIGSISRHFDDREQAREALVRRRARRAGAAGNDDAARSGAPGAGRSGGGA